MKKFAVLLVAALIAFAPALAQAQAGSAYTIELPEGFRAVDEAEMQGYREAANQDSGVRYEGEAQLFVRDGASISVLHTPSDYADAQAAAEGLIAEYAGYIDGFEAVVPDSVEAGGRAFARVQFSLDGELTSQYFWIEDATLYILTFVGAEEDEIRLALEGFAPVAGDAQPQASATAAIEPEP